MNKDRIDKNKVNRNKGSEEMENIKPYNNNIKVKKVDKKKRDEIYKKLTTKNKKIYERLAK